MELSFSTTLLRSICEHEKIAHQHFDQEVARELRARIADMVAAESLADIPDLLLTSSIHKGQECILLQLPSGKSINFIAGHTKLPILKAGGVDWSKVYRVKIIEIGGLS
ncbi:MAG: hypothetical protein ABUS47_00245 [Steroidobacter sp.]